MEGILYAALSLGVLGLIFGVLLGFASKKFHVEVDQRIPRIRECLPSANCGGCGYAGCDAYAEAVVTGEAKGNLCSVGGAKVAEDISGLLGVALEENNKKTAFVKCGGTCEKAKSNYEYENVTTCLEASLLPNGGAKKCTYGCLGLGSCVSVCDFGALDIIDGIARVNREKCTMCGACIKICPLGLIEEVSYDSLVRVACNSKDSGKVVRENCSAGCIGCKICEKNCPSEAVVVNDFLAKVDYTKCTGCNICTTKCPTKAILNIE